MSNTETTSRYGRNGAIKAEAPAAPPATRNGSSGRQQLEAAITLPSAARLANAVLLEPDLLLTGFSSTCDICFAVQAVCSVKFREQRTTVLMLDFPLQAQLAIAITEGPCQLHFEPGKTRDLLANVLQFALEHGLHFGTSVMLLPQRQQFLDLVQRETELLRVPHKLEVANLLPAE